MRPYDSARRPTAPPLIAAAGVFVASLGLVACAHPSPPHGTAMAATPVVPIHGPLGGAASCLTSDATRSFPPIDVSGGSDPAALPLSPQPVAVTGGVAAQSSPTHPTPPGLVELDQVITDFPVPAAAVPGPGLAVTLVQLSGTLPPRGHWPPDQSMALQSTRQLGPGQVMVWQSCALHSPQLEAAMRAAGHTTIPASVITSPPRCRAGQRSPRPDPPTIATLW